MGTDIHILIQIFDNDKWKLVQLLPNNTLSCITSEEYENLCKKHEKCQEFYYDPKNEKCVNDECDCIHDYNDCWCFDDFNIHFDLRRDYRFFAKIANVRNRFEDMDYMEPKGPPHDLDQIARYIFIDEDENKIYKYISPIDLHSHTYLYDNEIDNINFIDNLGLEELKELLKLIRTNFPDKQSRFLICFDN